MKTKEILPSHVARRLRLQSNEAFYSWVKIIITIATTFLSILIAFKGNYVPQDPQYLFLLSASFVCFLLTIFSGIVVLHTEIQTKLEAANRIDTIVFNEGEEAAAKDMISRGSKSIAKPVYHYMQYIFHIMFGLAFSLVVTFVILNP